MSKRQGFSRFVKKYTLSKRTRGRGFECFGNPPPPLPLSTKSPIVSRWHESSNASVCSPILIKRSRPQDCALTTAYVVPGSSSYLRSPPRQPEVRLSWKLVPISSMRMSENTPILSSSSSTFDLKATFSGYESWRFVLKYEKAGGQNCRGNLPGWRIDGDDEMHDSRGDLREDINFIGADRESDFWFISILWPQVQSVDLEIQGRWFSSQPWSCIFRNWPRLGLKMYIFLTLEFTLLYLLATRVNAKYYPYCFFYWALIST